jgi:NADH dehydrogenase
MILVVGATGQLGGLIARTLLHNNTPVRVLVRGGSSYDGLAAAGAEPVIGDLTSPSSLRAATEGVDAVVTTANSMARGGADTVESVDERGNRNLIDAAASAGVRRLVFISALGASPDHPMPLLRAKGLAEERLRASGMTWTALRPNMYMETLPLAVVGGPALAGQPVTLIGEGRRRHSFVALRDVAAYVVAALANRESENQTLVIGGPQPLSLRDIVATFAEELGRDVSVRTLPPGSPVPGMPDAISGLLTALETYDSPIDSSALAASYGVTPTPFAAVVRDVVAASRQHVA